MEITITVILNGFTLQDGVRKNNDYQDAYFGGVLRTADIGRRKNFRIGYKGSTINQGLPGAVILYNETADERLSTLNHEAFADYLRRYDNSMVRVYVNAQDNQLNYLDPNYLNNSGGLDVTYTNRRINAGIKYHNFKKYKRPYRAGIEQLVSGLNSSDTTFSKPLRFQTFATVGGDWDTRVGKFTLDVSSQFVHEVNREGESAEDLVKVNPYFKFLSKAKGRMRWAHVFWYRNTFRMPTFNELYYNNIGNNKLLPETAHQLNYGVQFIPMEKYKTDMFVQVNGFYNRVNNKIVAIPTKNLFVWSMQNVTDVNVYGGEAQMEFTYRINDLLYVKTIGNYTFQHAVDVTPGSLNEGDQIAYVPNHTANLDFSLRWRRLGVRFANNFISSRYALNENIDANLIEGFVTSDVGIHYDIPFSKKVMQEPVLYT